MAAKKSNNTRFRRINEWLHLWLGLLSGIVVFVVCLTAAIWVFRDEVDYFTKPFNRIEAENSPFLPPSALRYHAEHYLDSTLAGKPVLLHNVTYRRPGQTTFVGYLDSTKSVYMGYLHLNPYTGNVVHNELFAESNTRNFFIFIRAGHRFFWLPQRIGSPVVGVSCIIFLITLITGIIWWYPKKWTRATRAKSFKIKWRAGWKRVNLDLHNVAGFYSLLFAFILTYTGVYYSFEWFRDGYHYILGERNQTIGSSPPQSTPNGGGMETENPLDVLWETIYYGEENSDGQLSLTFIRDSISPVVVTYNPDHDRHYRAFTRHFDQYSLEELNAGGFSSRGSNLRFEELTVGQKIIRMNFDIHVGTIGGLPTKILAAIVSLVGASLPVTGFIIWYNRKWGKKKRKKVTVKSLQAL